MSKRQYSEEELRDKLGEVISSKIQSLTCDCSGIHIYFKDGFRGLYKGRYEKEVHVKLIREMREACGQIQEDDESYFSYMEEKIKELSPEAKEKIERYQYGWKSFMPPYVFYKDMLVLWFKPESPNDYETWMGCKSSPYLTFSFNQLDNGEHLKATQMEYFLDTPEHAARLVREAREKEENKNKVLENHFALGGRMLDDLGSSFFTNIQSLTHKHWPGQKAEVSFTLKEQNKNGFQTFSTLFPNLYTCKEVVAILENLSRKDREKRTDLFESLFRTIGQKLDELSPQTKERIERYSMTWNAEREDDAVIDLEFKEGVLNDYQTNPPLFFLRFTLKDLH
ncbi:MAG: hypothetical protein K2H85_01150, partial [Allobaculum sp.]|nr:hypothetical protein [Allobaculum sp.]